MRVAALAVLLFLAPTALSQDWVSAGQIESIEYKNEVPGPGGRGVAGTEFFHLEYKVSLRTVQTAEVQEAPGGPLRCVQECLGKIHKQHSECTQGTCDTPCTKVHERQIRGTYKPNIPNMRAARADSGNLARAAGAGLGPDHWSSATSAALRQIKEDAEQLHRVTMGHSDKACGVLHGWHSRRKFQTFVKGEFRKVGYYMSGGKKAPIDQPAGSHEKMVAETWIPYDPPSRIEEGWICHCNVQDQPKTPGTPVRDGPSRVPGPARTPTYSGLGWRKADGTVVIPTENQVSVKAVGDGASNVRLVIENKTSEDLICTTDPGTVGDPKNLDVQLVIFLLAADIVLRANSTTEVSLSEGGGPAADYRAKAVCIEMKKQPPTAQNILQLRPSKDDVLAALAIEASNALAVGPWDQARIWIYTDKATLDEINERMSPGVGAGQYVEALCDLERIGGVDASDPKYRRCFDSALLPAEGASGEATVWFVNRLSSFDVRATVMVLDKQSADWINKVNAATDIAVVQHYARIFGALTASKDVGVRARGLAYLGGIVEAQRPIVVVRAGGLDNLASALTSEDAQEVQAAMSIVEAYRLTEFKPTLIFLTEKGDDDKIKQRAKEILRALG